MGRIAKIALLVVLGLLAAVSPATAGAADKTAPRVRFATSDDAVVVAAPVDSDATRIRGVATDRNGRGVKSVSVVYCGNAERLPRGGYRCGTSPVVVAAVERRAATTTCSNRTRRWCRWSAEAPRTPGRYIVMATATDRAGNVRSAGPVFITVL